MSSRHPSCVCSRFVLFLFPLCTSIHSADIFIVSNRIIAELMPRSLSVPQTSSFQRVRLPPPPTSSFHLVSVPPMNTLARSSRVSLLFPKLPDKQEHNSRTERRRRVGSLSPRHACSLFFVKKFGSVCHLHLTTPGAGLLLRYRRIYTAGFLCCCCCCRGCVDDVLRVIFSAVVSKQNVPNTY